MRLSITKYSIKVVFGCCDYIRFDATTLPNDCAETAKYSPHFFDICSPPAHIGIIIAPLEIRLDQNSPRSVALMKRTAVTLHSNRFVHLVFAILAVAVFLPFHSAFAQSTAP